MEIDALLLAAGYGTRLRPLTLRIPKALLPIHGTSLLDYHIERLLGGPGQADGRRATASVRRVVVNAHHMAERVEAHLADHPRREHLALSFEPEILGTGGAIWKAREHLETDPFIVLNADALFPAPLEIALEFHRDSGHLATMVLTRSTLWPNVIVQGDRVADILPDRCAPSAFTFTGCHVISRELIDLLPRGTFHDIVRGIYRSLIAQRRLGALIAPPEIPFIEVGTPARYLEAHRLCAREEARRYGLPGPRGEARHYRLPESRGEARHYGLPEPGGKARAHRGDYSFIDPRAQVDEGARIRESIVLQGARVGRDARILRAIIGPGAKAEGTITDRMLTADGSVPISG